MTKYILHGGETRRKSEDNKKFFFEMTDGLFNPVNILCVYFAKEKKLWPQLLKEDKVNFSSVAPKKVLNFVLADEKTDVLVEQIKKADVIYLRGGKTGLLKKTLSKVKNLPELWKDKIVSGSSAGAYVLARYYQGNDYGAHYDVVGEGLGILPIKVYTHYSAEHRDQLEKLKKSGEELKVYAIAEKKFFVIEQ